MIWQTGTPDKEGTYLCANKKGDGYRYGIQLWKNGAWWHGDTPETWADIPTPSEEMEGLDNMMNDLYEDEQ